MQQVVVPVRYPLTEHSTATLGRAIDVATDRDAELTVLHVDPYYDGRQTSRAALKNAVEDAFGRLSQTRYVVRRGFIVEETILDEIVAQRADVVVIGEKQASRWRRMIRRLVDDPDIEDFLRNELDCDVVTAAPPAQ